MSFKLPMIGDISLINDIVKIGYQRTGNKFSISFNGSKNHLCNIEITCEGHQQEQNNKISMQEFTSKDGSIKPSIVNIYHSKSNGIRLSTSICSAKQIEDDNYLPF